MNKIIILLLLVAVSCGVSAQDTLVSTIPHEWAVAPPGYEFQPAPPPSQPIVKKFIRKPAEVNYDIDVSVPPAAVAVNYKRVQAPVLPEPRMNYIDTGLFISDYSTWVTAETTVYRSKKRKKKKQKYTFRTVRAHPVKVRPDVPIMQNLTYLFYMKRSHEYVEVKYMPEETGYTVTVWFSNPEINNDEARYYFNVSKVSKVQAVQFINQTLTIRP